VLLVPCFAHKKEEKKSKSKSTSSIPRGEIIIIIEKEHAIYYSLFLIIIILKFEKTFLSTPPSCYNPTKHTKLVVLYVSTTSFFHSHFLAKGTIIHSYIP